MKFERVEMSGIDIEVQNLPAIFNVHGPSDVHRFNKLPAFVKIKFTQLL